MSCLVIHIKPLDFIFVKGLFNYFLFVKQWLNFMSHPLERKYSTSYKERKITFSIERKRNFDQYIIYT